MGVATTLRGFRQGYFSVILGRAASRADDVIRAATLD